MHYTISIPSFDLANMGRSLNLSWIEYYDLIFKINIIIMKSRFSEMHAPFLFYEAKPKKLIFLIFFYGVKLKSITMTTKVIIVIEFHL